jgi:hypothetical protein
VARSPIKAVYERADDIALAALAAYHSSLIRQGIALVDRDALIAEIAEWLRNREGISDRRWAERNYAADAILRRFAPGNREEQ